MISTMTAGGAGPVAGYIAAAGSTFLAGYLRTWSTRKNALVPALLATPATQPQPQGPYIPAMSYLGNYTAIAVTNVSSGNGFLVYSRSGNTFTALSVPGTITGGHYSSSITSDGVYIATSKKIYHNNAGSLTSLVVSSMSATAAGSLGDYTAINPTGVFVASDKVVVSGGTTQTRSLLIGKRSGSGSSATYGDHQTITLSTGGTSATLEGLRAAAFSPDGTYLMVATSLSPYLRAYKYTSGTDTWAALSNQPPSGGTLPDAVPTYGGISWSADSTMVAVATTAKTFIYERSGDTFTHRATLSVADDGYTGGFHSRGNYYITGGARVYKKNSVSSWTLYSALNTFGGGLSFSGATFSLA